jgi:hypothetical protein
MESNSIDSPEQIWQKPKTNVLNGLEEDLLFNSQKEIKCQQTITEIENKPNDIDLKFLAMIRELEQVLPKWENWLEKLSNYLTEWQDFNLEDIPSDLANSSKILIYELNSYLEIACNNLNDMWILLEWSKLGPEQKKDTSRDVVWELVYDLYSRCGRIMDCENHPYLGDINQEIPKYDWTSTIVKCRPELENIIIEEININNPNLDDEIVIKTTDFSGIPQLPNEAVFDKSVRDIKITCEKLGKENSIKTTLLCAKEVIDESPLILLPSINSQARAALKRTLMEYNI